MLQAGGLGMRGHFPWHNPYHFLELWSFVLKTSRSASGLEGYRWRKTLSPAGNHAAKHHPIYQKTLGKYTCLIYDALTSSHDQNELQPCSESLARPLPWAHNKKIIMFLRLKYICFTLSLWPNPVNRGLAVFSLIIFSDKFHSTLT